MIPRLKRWLDIRPGEGLPVFYAALYIGIATASFLLAKPVRNALFLQQYGAYKLAYAYVAVPLVLAVFVPVYEAIAARIGQRLVITGSLVFLAGNVLLFWWGFRFLQAGWLAAAFYVWVNCYAVIAPVQAWGFANATFDTRQARRLFSVVGAGASLGAIVGGLLARVLVGWLGTVNLLLVLAGLIVSAAVVVNLAWGVRQRQVSVTPRRPRTAVSGTLALIARTRYLRSMAALVVLVAIVTQWTGFQFNLVVAERYGGDADAITRFTGAFNLVMGLASFAAQLAITGPLLRNFGLSLTLLILPVAIASGSLLTVLFPVFWAVILTNTFDQGLHHSVDKASFELLYLPVSSEIRTRVKAAIDLVVNRAADGLGGVLLVLATQGVALGALQVPGANLGLRGLAAASLAMTAAWALVAWRLRAGYVDAIRESIQQRRLDTTRTVSRVLDRSATEMLAGKLQGSDDEEVLYALGLLESQRGRRLHPAVRGLLSHSSAEVRRRALALLDDAGDVASAAEVKALLKDPDPETRADALLFLAHHVQDDPLPQIRTISDFPEHSIQAAMIGFYCKPGPMQNLDAAGFMLDHLIDADAGATTESRLEAAKLLGSLPMVCAPQLRRLLHDDDLEVRRAAVVSSGRSQALEVVDLLTPMLADQRLAEEASHALSSIGGPAVAALAATLADDAQPMEVRRRIPPILASIATEDAQRALYDNLLVADVVLRYRAITALARLQRQRPGLGVDREAIEMVLAAEIMGHYRSYQIHGSLREALASDRTVSDGIEQSIRQERERIFGLLGLLTGTSDIEDAYAALGDESASVRANALELLDNVLSADLRRLVVPLVDPAVSFAERVKIANRLVGTAVDSHEEAAQALMASDDPWLRSCGVWAVGALHLESLSGEIEKLAASDDALLRETAREARRKLAVHEAAHEPVPEEALQETGIFDLQQDAGGIG